MRSEFEDAVRVCALTERPDLVELVAGWHWKEWGSDEGDETRVDWVRRVRSRSSDGVPFTLVCFLGGDPVGAVSACWDDRRDGFPTDEPWLSGMVVRNEARNLGVGRVLLGAAEERCHGLGFRRIWLHTGEAKRFYERCGWPLVRDKQALHDDAVLCRALGSG